MKTITLTAAQMTTLVIVYSYYNFDSGVDSQVQAIMLKYPQGIPPDCQETFKIDISTTEGEGEGLLGIILYAIKEDGLSDHKEVFMALKLDIEILLNTID